VLLVEKPGGRAEALPFMTEEECWSDSEPRLAPRHLFPTLPLSWPSLVNCIGKPQ